MPTAVQFRRGTTSQHSSFTGAAGEITVDTDKDVAVVHDGSTAGGFPLAAIAKAQTFTAAQRGTVSALSDGATITPNFATANNFSVTLGGTAHWPTRATLPLVKVVPLQLLRMALVAARWRLAATGSLLMVRHQL